MEQSADHKGPGQAFAMSMCISEIYKTRVAEGMPLPMCVHVCKESQN